MLSGDEFYDDEVTSGPIPDDPPEPPPNRIVLIEDQEGNALIWIDPNE
jgi:hypothetical protein